MHVDVPEPNTQPLEVALMSLARSVATRGMHEYTHIWTICMPKLFETNYIQNLLSSVVVETVIHHIGWTVS